MKYLFLIVFISSSIALFSQDYFYLEDVIMKKAAHFTENNETAMKALEYLESTPINEEDKDREVCNRFIMRFVEGSPDCSIMIGMNIMNLTGKDLDLLILYVGYWLEVELETPDESAEFYQNHVYQQLYNYCKGDNNVKKTKEVKKLIKLGDQGSLSEMNEVFEN